MKAVELTESRPTGTAGNIERSIKDGSIPRLGVMRKLVDQIKNVVAEQLVERVLGQRDAVFNSRFATGLFQR